LNGIIKVIHIKDIERMIIVKNKKVFKIKPKDISSFYIGNTINFSEYKSGEYIEKQQYQKKLIMIVLQQNLMNLLLMKIIMYIF
jgi:hypothetical protein